MSYSITFKNGSSNHGRVCIFQKQADLPPDVHSVAWFARTAAPKTQVRFTWDLTYCFVWSLTGAMVPGRTIIFPNQPGEITDGVEAGQILQADLATLNQVTLSCADQSCAFVDGKGGPRSGKLGILTDATIPGDRLACGFGMAGRPTFVTQAKPRQAYRYRPRPEYWISFGQYRPGEVLAPDPDSSMIAQVEFPANVFSVTATLQAGNTWDVRPTSP